MISQLESLRQEALSSLATAANAEALEQWRIQYLSRQGSLPKLLEGMKNVAKEDRPHVGKVANEVKNALQSAFDEKKASFETASFTQIGDTTLPGRPFLRGGLHPVNQTLGRLIAIFRRLGYALADGPEVENEHHNFDALNTPKDHPARNEQDTFYVDLPPHVSEGRWLLRTHTSPVQIRTMLSQKPPIQIIAPGRCYRRDEVDATHGMHFNQIEGLCVAEGIHLGHLIGTLELLFKELLGPAARVRLRPHFFPFTEPSFEVDMSSPNLKLKGSEWTEIAGCGMVDPAVLEGVGIDPEKYTGFAFGMGVERLTMLLHDIPDLRLFAENDVRFLRQFTS